MYYILNETNQIVAADDTLLSLCGVSHIDELLSALIQKSTTFDTISEDTIKIILGDEEESYTASKTSLSSLLGQLTLVSLQDETDREETSDESTLSVSEDTALTNDSDITLEDEKNDIIDSILNDNNNESLEIGEEPDTLDINDTEETMDLLSDDVEEPITFGDESSNNDEPISLIEDTSKENTPPDTVETPDDSELFDLLLDDEKPLDIEDKLSTDNIALDEMALFDDAPKKVDVAEININVSEVSSKIGISTEDYNTFLNDFIDTALEVEKDLQSSDIDKQAEAIGTLSHLSDVLHIPIVGDIIDTIANTSNEEQREVIESFYTAISQITITETKKEVDDLPIEEELPNIMEEEKLELFDEAETVEEPKEEVAVEKVLSANSFGSISLEGIKPKHFDFQLEEAANDLSLPVELIEEFVHDFIEQSHIETKKMIEAHEDGDFDTIKKIGHLLKGASSNLRINALSDTLYKIQFCEDPSTLEPLIKDYWAHFLSFENQINVISN